MRTYLRGSLLIDGTGREPLVNPLLILEAGKIIQVCKIEDIVIPADARIIDCTPGTLLPGLVDAHAHAGEDAGREESIQQQHLQPDAVRALRGSISLQHDLHAGVTTIRLLGDGTGCVDKHLRDMIAQGELAGPRVLAACLALRPSHGTAPEIGICADGAEEVRKCVRKAISLGADVIKLFVSNISQGHLYTDYLKGDLTDVAAYTRSEIEVAAEEAHRAGLKLACHCLGGKAVRWALEAGADSLEHCNLLQESDIECFQKHRGIISDPNLQLFFDKDYGFSSSANKTHKWNDLPDWWHQKVWQARENTRSVLSKALQAGIMFALGTDLNHGRLWLEGKYFVTELGATPIQAIQAMTYNGAVTCGMADQIGSIEPGKQADILCVRNNPLDDISHLKDVLMVIKEGIICLDRR